MIGASLLLASELVLWHAYSGAEEEALSQVVQRWNNQGAQTKSGTTTKVQAVGVPYEVLATKLKAAIPRGHGPDLFIMAHNFLGEWQRYGVLQKLNELPDGPAFEKSAATLLPQTVAPLRKDGSLFGLPLSWKSLALFYRTDQITKPPQTTGELLTLCDKIRQDSEGQKTPHYGLAYESAAFFFHAAWFHGLGGSVFPGSSDKPVLTSKEAVLSLHFVKELTLRKDIPEEMTSVLVTQLFNQGHAAMVMNGPWFIGQIDKGVPYSVAPLPVMDKTGNPAAGFTTIETGFLNPQSPRVHEAGRFLRYLVEPEAAKIRAVVGRQIVTTKATWQDPQVSGDPLLTAFFKGHEHLVPTDSRPEMNAVWEPMAQALRQVLRGAHDPETALNKAQKSLDLFLRPLPDKASYAPYGVLLSGLLLLLLAGLSYRLRQGLLPAIWKNRGAYGYLFPAAISMVLLVFLPFAIGAGMSMFVVDPEGRWRFVGLANFVSILGCKETSLFDPLSFYYTLPVTLLWTLLNIVFHVLIGLSLAILLRDPLLRLRGVYRMLLLIPWAIPNYITALIWKGMFNRQFGAVNGILVFLGIPPVSWFGSFFTALSANVTTNVWLGFPFMMVVALGALSQIPKEVEEAAVLDGATRWQRLRHIVLPLLLPQLLPSILLGAVWTFNMFNIVFLVSGGEPDGATEILVSQAYRWAFTRGHRYGYAAAYAVLIFVVLLFQSALLRRVSDRER